MHTVGTSSRIFKSVPPALSAFASHYQWSGIAPPYRSPQQGPRSIVLQQRIQFAQGVYLLARAADGWHWLWRLYRVFSGDGAATYALRLHAR
jgi:hypothetical protein